MTLQQIIARRAKCMATAAQKLGARIDSIDRLAEIAAGKKSVFCRNAWGLLPAVVVMNMPASCVHRAVRSGAVFEYQPKP